MADTNEVPLEPLDDDDDDDVPSPSTVSLRQYIHFTLSRGLEFSKAAFAYQLFQNTVIWLSVINFLVSSLPQYWDRDLLIIEIIEKVSVGIFTVDYIARLVTATPGKRCRWIIQPMHLFDLAVIIPFYIEVILKHGTNFNPADVSILVIIRALRLFQMFRTVQIARYSSLVTVFIKAIKLSKDGFILFTFTVTILMVVVSAVFFYGEQTVQDFDHKTRIWVYPSGTVSPFQSIPSTFWWFMATVTTVGYGDVSPKSDLGKFIAAITMIGGLFVLAVPVAVFGSNFSTVWEERLEHLKKKATETRIKKYDSMNKIELVQALEEAMRRFSIKLNKHNELVEKLVEDEKGITQLIKILSKFKSKTGQVNQSHDIDIINITQ